MVGRLPGVQQTLDNSQWFQSDYETTVWQCLTSLSCYTRETSPTVWDKHSFAFCNPHDSGPLKFNPPSGNDGVAKSDGKFGGGDKQTVFLDGGGCIRRRSMNVWNCEVLWRQHRKKENQLTESSLCKADGFSMNVGVTWGVRGTQETTKCRRLYKNMCRKRRRRQGAPRYDFRVDRHTVVDVVYYCIANNMGNVVIFECRHIPYKDSVESHFFAETATGSDEIWSYWYPMIATDAFCPIIFQLINRFVLLYTQNIL